MIVLIPYGFPTKFVMRWVLLEYVRPTVALLKTIGILIGEVILDSLAQGKSTTDGNEELLCPLLVIFVFN